MNAAGFVLFALVTGATSVTGSDSLLPRQDVAALCRAIDTDIESHVKALKFEDIELIGKLAPEGTLSYLRQIAARSAIQGNLTHMNSLGCPPIRRLLSPSEYGVAGAFCLAARISQTSVQRSGTTDEIKRSTQAVADRCDVEKWLRNEDWKPPR